MTERSAVLSTIRFGSLLDEHQARVLVFLVDQHAPFELPLYSPLHVNLQVTADNAFGSRYQFLRLAGLQGEGVLTLCQQLLLITDVRTISLQPKEIYIYPGEADAGWTAAKVLAALARFDSFNIVYLDESEMYLELLAHRTADTIPA